MDMPAGHNKKQMQRNSRSYQVSPMSVTSLIVSNTIPLFGVLFLGWSIGMIMLLFSLENIVIGFWNVAKIFVAPCDMAEFRRKTTGISTKKGMAIFFTMHYGGFCSIHLLFACFLFAFPDPAGISFWSVTSALFALWLSHGISFWMNFIKGGEYKRITGIELMLRPYGRILVMHITIIAGGFVAVFLGAPIFALLLLVVLKTILDLVAHMLERKKFAAKA